MVNCRVIQNHAGGRQLPLTLLKKKYEIYTNNSASFIAMGNSYYPITELYV